VITTLLSIINNALPILDKLLPDDAMVIRRKKIDYERKRHEELSKGDMVDDALLDLYDRELQHIGELLSAALERSQAKN